MHPSDYGPTYTETVPGLVAGSFPVEPWKTWSNLIFVVLFVHIALRSRLDYRRYPLIVFSLPILAVGIVGGTVYHATRSHFMWLFLDFMPIKRQVICN
jgi:hemolysin III